MTEIILCVVVLLPAIAIVLILLCMRSMNQRIDDLDEAACIGFCKTRSRIEAVERRIESIDEGLV